MRGKLINFNLDQLRKEVLLAMEKNVFNITIWDSAFNASPIFKEVCKMITEVDKDKLLNLECFVQADLIDEESAMLMKESGFRSVEVGLQSADTRVLTNVNRSMDLSRFIQGVRFLEKAGIKVKTDVIVGLPGDSLETFEKTMKFISENRLDPILFHLSLGYGTSLRKRAGEFCMALQQLSALLCSGEQHHDPE